MSEISTRITVCCTCLSTERKLYPLYKILDGINLLYMLLTHDPEAYKEGFYKNSASLLVCWECCAIIHRIRRFQAQVCVAQKKLAEGQNVKLKSFSRLKIVHNRTSHYIFQSAFLTENFIDCGPAKDIITESDSDDMPLSALYYENASDSEESGYSNIHPDNSNMKPDYSNMQPGNINMKPDYSNIHPDNSNMKPDYSNMQPGNINMKPDYSNIHPDNSNMKPDYSNMQPGNINMKPDNSNIQPNNSNFELDNINMKPDYSNMKPNNNNIQPNNSNIEPDNSKMKPDYSNMKPDNSSIKLINLNMEPAKPGKIKVTSKKKTKMKYSKYFSVTILSEQEMLKSVEKRKIDLDKDAAFKCDNCILLFKTENKLLNHNRELHSKKDNIGQCDLCHAYIEDVHTHRQSHYCCYKCLLCTHISYTHTDIARHIKGDHYEICCGKRKSSKRKLKQLCLEEPRYPCPECDLNFHNKDLRWKHVQKAHREGFQCSWCDKKFAFKNNLERHERIHRGPLPREECPTCHKMIRLDLLKVHSRIHTNRQEHTCVECDKRFVSRETYESHLKYAQAHATVEVCRHKCGVCEKRYRSRGELRDHVNYQHKGQAEHKCPICNKGLATKRCIRRHVRRAHEGIKESAKDKICQQCGKAFRDKKGLIEHERVHSGARPLACRVCGRAFRQRAALYAHTRRMHNTT